MLSTCEAFLYPANKNLPSRVLFTNPVGWFHSVLVLCLMVSIIQREVPILPEDSLEDLEARIHAVEHEIYVQAVRQALEQIEARS